jgi:2-aminoethylphosphonate-pyruvate transaminase
MTLPAVKRGEAVRDVPLLLTPGPLTTSDTVKHAMLRDWGSRDDSFIAMNREVRERLIDLAGARGTHVCVPLQGSGTFAVEATLATLVAPGDKLLVLVNGAYGARMVEMARRMQRDVEQLQWREDEQVDCHALDSCLGADQGITHVAVVHCETTSGILNPLAQVAETVARHERALIIDAMSTFGALEIDAREVPFVSAVASSGKCLEGVPGMGFALIRRDALELCRGNAHSLSLDLFAQWQGFEKNEQWRFTPPTQVIAALRQALDEHASEGGVKGRGARYARNHWVLVDEMEEMGFRCLVAREMQSPIIATFLMPADPNFEFSHFYERLRSRGFLIYPGKVTVADSFRIGCIGHIGETEIRDALDAIRTVLVELGVSNVSPIPT